MRLDNTSSMPLLEPFNFWPWLLEAELAHAPSKTYSIELLPALRAQYPGCVSDRVTSVRLSALPPDSHIGVWCFNVVEFSAEHQRLTERCVPDVTPITQEGGDCYNYGDHPANEFPGQLLEAVFRPGLALVIGETLGIFRPESLRMLQALADSIEDIERYCAETQAKALEQRLLGQARHHRDLAVYMAEELCRDLNLAASARQSLRQSQPFGIHGDEALSLWDEVLHEARQDSLVSEGFEDAVYSAVHAAFKALPRAKQLAYWLLHGTAERELKPGGDWLEPERGPEECEFFDLELALRKAVRGVWGLADDEAYRTNESKF